MKESLEKDKAGFSDDRLKIWVAVEISKGKGENPLAIRLSYSHLHTAFVALGIQLRPVSILANFSTIELDV